MLITITSRLLIAGLLFLVERWSADAAVDDKLSVFQTGQGSFESSCHRADAAFWMHGRVIFHHLGAARRAVTYLFVAGIVGPLMTAPPQS
ncbi:MAG: hypothetical protein R3F65_26740 [bacterium]